MFLAHFWSISPILEAKIFFLENPGRKDGLTLFHRTILATAGGPKILFSIFESQYSRIDKSQICGRQPLTNLNRHDLPKADHKPSHFLKTVFHKFYLIHSWILCPISKSLVNETPPNFAIVIKDHQFSKYTNISYPLIRTPLVGK